MIGASKRLAIVIAINRRKAGQTLVDAEVCLFCMVVDSR